MSGPGAAPGGEKKKSKTGLIIGGCCALLLLIGCGVGGYLYWAGQQAVAAGGTIDVEVNRLSMNIMLSGIQSSCAMDPSGAAAASYFHPNVAATYQSQACQVTADVVTAFSDPTRATGTVVAGSPDESWAVAVGADTSQCYSFVSGTAKVVGCNMPDGFKIVHMENVSMVAPPG
jgi:hypothetical protein